MGMSKGYLNIQNRYTTTLVEDWSITDRVKGSTRTDEPEAREITVPFLRQVLDKRKLCVNQTFKSEYNFSKNFLILSNDCSQYGMTSISAYPCDGSSGSLNKYILTPVVVGIVTTRAKGISSLCVAELR